MTFDEFYVLSAWIIPLLLAITLHEAAHGYAAWRCGDSTAFNRGRLSLNPFRHIDLVGTILIPAVLLWLRAPFLFGYAKPVPVNFSNLRRPRRDTILVAIAGPATNLLLAISSIFLLNLERHLPPEEWPWLYMKSDQLSGD